MFLYDHRRPEFRLGFVPTVTFGVDWSHPITRGLVAAYIPGSGYGLSCAVTRFQLTPETSYTGILSTGVGGGIGGGGTFLGAYSSSGLPASWNSLTAASHFWYGSLLGAGSGGMPLCGLLYDVTGGASPYSVSVLEVVGTTCQCQINGSASGAQWSLADATSRPAGIYAIGGGFSASRTDLYVNGVSVANDTGHAAPTYSATTGYVLNNFHAFMSSSLTTNALTALALMWNRKLADAEMLALSSDPFQMFKPTASERSMKTPIQIYLPFRRQKNYLRR